MQFDPVRRRDRAFLKPRRGHHDLEHRARRVLALDGAVEQRVLGILDHPQPGVAVDGAREAIDLEGRRGHHRQDVAVAGIHHDHGAGVALHGLLGGLLDPAVDRGDDLGPGWGSVVLDQPHLAAHGVHLDALAAVLAAQELVEQPLQPVWPTMSPRR